MQTKHSIFVVIGLVALLGFSLLVAPNALAAPAAQRASVSHHIAPLAVCYGPSCVGKQPYPYWASCGGDQQNVAPARLRDGVTVELMWSPSCAANWAYLTTGPISTPFYVHTTDGTTEWGTSDGTTTGLDEQWSPMVNGLEKAQACLYDSSGSNCTGWY